MKKISKNIVLSLLPAFGLGARSDKLDLAPISSITDGNYWQSVEQFDAFVSGVYTALEAIMPVWSSRLLQKQM